MSLAIYINQSQPLILSHDLFSTILNKEPRKHREDILK